MLEDLKTLQSKYRDNLPITDLQLPLGCNVAAV